MVAEQAPEAAGKSSQVHTHFFQEPTKLLLEQVVAAAKGVFILIQLKTALPRVLQMARMENCLQ
jgi:hypothetical protein